MNDVETQALTKSVQRITRPAPQLLTYYLLMGCLGVVAAPVLWPVLFFRYQTLWYRFDDQGVSMGYGILFRREVQLTYARMQDIHLSQNIVERWLGIGTVTVQTAGGSSGHLRIDGVKEFEAIRDYLYLRMRGVRGATASHEAESTTLLREIRDALNDTANALRPK